VPTAELTAAEWRESELRRMSEKTFMAQVIKTAKQLGWICYHTYRATHSPAGFPDLVLVRCGFLILAELKREAGRLTIEQTCWLLNLAQGLGHVYVWRPRDLYTVAVFLADPYKAPIPSHWREYGQAAPAADAPR
jgi:hypothetical protein